MATINIGLENSEDPFHRYKMPKPVSKIEGRGNGIKTNVVNNVDIAKALERPAGYIIKYFGFELGAQTSFDVKSGTSIVNGAHDANMLMKLTESFIKTYVQCYSCGNPETVIKIRKENIQLNCKACGHVSLVDMKHKMNNYILKNPPENKLSKEEKKLKKQEKERLGALESKGSSKKEKDKDKDREKKKKDKSKKKKEDQPSDSGNKENDAEEQEQGSSSQKDPEPQKDSDPEEDGGDDDGEVTWSTDVSAEAIKRRAAEQLTGAVSAMVTQGNIEAERKDRKKRLKKDMKVIGLEDDVVDSVYEVRKLVQSPGTKSVEEAVKQTSAKAAVRMQILYLALFWDVDGKLADKVKEHSTLLATFASDSRDQLAQLIGVEFVLGQAFPDRASETSLVLNALYEEDVIGEELIIAWYQRPSAGEQALGTSPEASKLVRKNAEKLVQFLEEDEDEEDDEEDDDEEE